jgi:hypothetical protein
MAMRTLEEIRAEWRLALKEFEEAQREYEPFLAQPIKLGEGPIPDPIPIPYEKLKAAHDKLKKAQEWLRRIEKEFYGAVEKGLLK